MVLHVLEAAAKLDPSRSLVVVGHQADDVSEAVGDRAGCVLQAEQLGTGHALSMTRAALRGFKGDLLVLAGECQQIMEAEHKFRSEVQAYELERQQPVQTSPEGDAQSDPPLQPVLIWSDYPGALEDIRRLPVTLDQQ